MMKYNDYISFIQKNANYNPQRDNSISFMFKNDYIRRALASTLLTEKAISRDLAEILLLKNIASYY